MGRKKTTAKKNKKKTKKKQKNKNKKKTKTYDPEPMTRRLRVQQTAHWASNSDGYDLEIWIYFTHTLIYLLRL